MHKPYTPLVHGAILALTAFSLLGCGRQPAAAKMSVTDLNPSAPAPIATPAPAAPASPGAAQPGPAAGGTSEPQAVALAQQVQQAFLALPGYQVGLQYWLKLGETVGTGATSVTGRPPMAMRVEVTKGNNAGTKLRYEGGKTAKVRPAGLFSGLTVDLPITDGRLLNTRGDTLDQFCIGGMLARFTDPSNRVSMLPPQAEGQAVRVEGPKLLKGCTAMVAVVDPQSRFPKAVFLYEGEAIVGRLTLVNFRPVANPKLDI